VLGLKLLGHYRYYESERQLPNAKELSPSGRETRLQMGKQAYPAEDPVEPENYKKSRVAGETARNGADAREELFISR